MYEDDAGLTELESGVHLSGRAASKFRFSESMSCTLLLVELLKDDDAASSPPSPPLLREQRNDKTRLTFAPFSDSKC